MAIKSDDDPKSTALTVYDMMMWLVDGSKTYDELTALIGKTKGRYSQIGSEFPNVFGQIGFQRPRKITLKYEDHIRERVKDRKASDYIIERFEENRKEIQNGLKRARETFKSLIKHDESFFLDDPWIFIRMHLLALDNMDDYFFEILFSAKLITESEEIVSQFLKLIYLKEEPEKVDEDLKNLKDELRDLIKYYLKQKRDEFRDYYYRKREQEIKK